MLVAVPQRSSKVPKVKLEQVQEEIDEDREACPRICKVWDFCHHPELCRNECWDRDLEKKHEAYMSPEVEQL